MNTSYPAFEHLRGRAIDSLNIRMEEYRHRASGAMHYHLAADSPENVFLVALRTVPMDSTGVAHILEHTALCGSRKFPVRDPFFMMVRRSLNTFMNAFTASDWTAYPFASKNRKDFDNLLQVYLDAVFFARLDELDFAQEGHRLEFTDAADPSTPLQFKGVVFNEMKGAMSSTANVLWQTLSAHLFPTTTYHYNSGGDPVCIPDLDYAGLTAFYRSHYRPGNAVFMTYGDIPAAEHQRRFEELALKELSGKSELSKESLNNHYRRSRESGNPVGALGSTKNRWIPAFAGMTEQVIRKFHRNNIKPLPEIRVGDERRYTEPLRVEDTYAAAPEDKDSHEPIKSHRTHVVTGWLLGLSTDLRAQFEAQLLSAVLLDHSASPLLKALETSPLGQSPSPLCGLEDSNREMAFMAGLEGCAADATEAVESLILRTLEDLVDSDNGGGVPQQEVESALHQLELSQREIAGDHYPYGLQLILEGLSAAIHRGDPISLLDMEPVLEQLREDIKDPAFIPGLIRSLLLDNPHRVTLTLRPDSGLEAKRQAEEEARLARIKAGLSPAQQAEIVARSRDLKARQGKADDPAVLPKVGLEDIPPEITEPQRQDCRVSYSTAGGASGRGTMAAAFYDAPTNGLAYQQVVMPLPPLDAELLEILPLYSSCITELGIGRRDYAEVQSWQAAVSGGVHCYSSIRSLRGDEQRPQACLSFASKGLLRNHEAFTELLHAVLTDARFDEGRRVRELVEQICSRKENSIPGQGHLLAMELACSRMSPAARFAFESTGLEGIRRLKARRARLRGGGDNGEGDAKSGSDVKDGSGAKEAAELLARMARLHALVQAAPKRFLLIAEGAHRQLLLDHVGARWADSFGNGNASGSSGGAAGGAAGGLGGAVAPLPLPAVRETCREARTTATAVNFCATAFPTVPAAHPDNPLLHVLAGFLRNNFLHRAVREQGGAYGAGASQHTDAAAFRFFSYRDPRLEETLADFERAVDWAVGGGHEPRLLEEAVLGVIGAMDKPSSPAGEARRAFYNHLFGRDIEQRMEFRRRVLNTTLDDLRRVAETYLKPERASIGLLTAPETAAKLSIPDLQVEAV